jgi:Zn-dependent M28 family amino/carboxypeptidase
VRRTPPLAAATAAFVTAAALVAIPAQAANPTDTEALRDAVTVDGIMAHEEELQAIADANGDTRASGTPGYRASVDYVEERLDAAGYDVTVQPFQFPFFQELSDAVFERISPQPRTYVVNQDFVTMEFSGSGDVTGQLFPTNDIVVPIGNNPPSTSNSGCEDSDFAPAPAEPTKSVALVQRGTCDFIVKARNAQEAGYDAVVVFNEGQAGRQATLSGTLGGTDVTIPVIGTSYAIGAELFSQTQVGPVTVRVRTETFSEQRTTWNVIADTTSGRTDRTVVVGAHLDSVLEGPGINDNGSGSATILEIAEEMAEAEVAPRNEVRFAFWGAEESGLLGSEHYVGALTKKQIQDIAVNLNFDMVASPNYVRFVYDGDGSDTAVRGPAGSGNVEDVFTEYFDSVGLESEPTEFSGRSDYGPFIAVGIPAGGLFTGAEGAKTAAQAAEYGGLATFGTMPDPADPTKTVARPVSYDPCYHQHCDSLAPQDFSEQSDPAYWTQLYAALQVAYPGQLDGNVNTLALDEMSDAAAHATLTFAMTGSDVSGASQGGGNGSPSAATSAEFKGSHLKR